MGRKTTNEKRLAIAIFLFFTSPLSRLPSYAESLIYTPQYTVEEALELPSSKELAVELLWQAWKKIPSSKRGRSGVVLSGGGSRGFAHIGVLHHLEEIGFPIEAMTGASMGAVVGGLYAAGVPILDIEKMAEEVDFQKLSYYSRWTFLKLGLKNGFASASAWDSWLRAKLGKKTFADLKIPFIACATDLASGELVLLRDGDLASSLLASATIPGLFAPVAIRQYFLVDGGILLNVPAAAASLVGMDNIFISDVSAYGHTEVMTREPSSLAALYRVIEAQGNRLERQQAVRGDFHLRFYPAGIHLFELWRWREAWEAGLQEARLNSIGIRWSFIEKTARALGPEFFMASAAATAQAGGVRRGGQ